MKNLLAITLITFASSTFAAGEIDLFGPAPAPKQEQPKPAPEPTPKSLVDTIEGVIQKGESLEQQGRRLKRLIDR